MGKERLCVRQRRVQTRHERCCPEIRRGPPVRKHLRRGSHLHLRGTQKREQIGEEGTAIRDDLEVR